MQISSKSLSKQQEKQLVNQLATVLADLHRPKQVRAFLQAFLTDTELSVFSKRLAILWELNQGKSYQEIKNKLQVSSATISSVSDVKNDHALQSGLEKMKLDKRIAAFVAQLQDIFPNLRSKK